ncbi:hypothetical protein [Vibrio cholerae]|uniref:hypothetical protein n=1 Tax=Vibrio cholerae TaxID=666 RepID=UPI001E302C51|nr:hypothetical protein [Vibrio cholerae]MCD1245841.1 hypothetical protein [Vibrio cholerae]
MIRLFCPLFIKCRKCQKERYSGFFYRHSKGESSGVDTNRVCLICENYPRYKDSHSYESYEAIRIQAYQDKLLENDGLFRCRKCNDIFSNKDKVKKKPWCPDCRKKLRSKEAKKEKLNRWNANSSQDYISKKKLSALDKKLSKLVSKYSANKSWQRYVRQHWLDNAKDEELAKAFDSIKMPWLNPRLTASEKYKLRYANDESFNIKERIRRQLKKKSRRDGVASLMRQALKRDGSSPKVEELLGYSISDLRKHLETLFEPEMNWTLFKNGAIHIDHIKPQSLFDLSDKEQWKECWDMSNLQPMWATDNLKKRNKYKEA